MAGRRGTRGLRHDMFDAHDAGQVREAFLAWYAARHDGAPQDAAEAVDTILYEW
jgi:hypothetical protein